MQKQYMSSSECPRRVASILDPATNSCITSQRSDIWEHIVQLREAVQPDPAADNPVSADAASSLLLQF